MNRLKFAVASVLCSAGLAGCSTLPPAAVPSSSPPAKEPAVPDAGGIDFVGLRRGLGLDPSPPGFSEKSFETCEVGYGFSRTRECRSQVLVVIRVQLQCRDSEGSEESAVSYRTTPIGAADVKWSLAGQKGSARTDGEGHAEIMLIASTSQREKKLRITHANDFLLVTAGEARRIVAPKSWCPN